MTDEGVTKTLAMFEATYGTTYSEAQVLTWRAILADVPDEAGMKACIAVMRTSPHPPKPSDVWTRCQPSKDEAQAQRQSEATLAWLHVRESIDNPYCSVLFEDRAIPLAISALGGIMELSQKTSEELDTFTRKDFERVYTSFKITGREHPTGYIAGFVETHNR